ncbi:hypothetical protein GGI22_003813 [Coemansia erecta]|nr:hypothetical protein GGI22_003813 [Coemansia erecta]
MREQSPAGDTTWDGEFTNAPASTIGSDDELEDGQLLSQANETISPSTSALTSRNGTPLQAEAQLPKPTSSAASRSATIQANSTPSQNAAIPENSVPTQSNSATPAVERDSDLQAHLSSNNTPCQDTNANAFLAQILAQDREIRRQEVLTRQEHLRLEREHLQLEREQLNLIREQMQMQKILTDQLIQVLTKMVDK